MHLTLDDYIFVAVLDARGFSFSGLNENLPWMYGENPI